MSSSRSPLLPLADARTYSAGGCEIWIWMPAPGVLASEVAGELSSGAATALTAALRRTVAEHGRVVVFHDWEQMTGYEPEARLQLTEVGREFKKQVVMSNILLRSRIVGLAVQAASLLIPNIKVHSSRATLDPALQQAILAARATPSSRGSGL